MGNPVGRREFLHRSLGVAVLAAVPRPLWAREIEPPAREFFLTAAISDVSVGPGSRWRTWAYNGVLPGPELRVREGERVRVVLRNELPEPTSIHWHGVPVVNAMDGVAGLTQKPVMPGESFVYEFVAAPAGTYFYHSHVGLQLDRGLYGALIIEPAEEPLLSTRPDREYVLLLDDWLNIEPDAALARMRQGGGMGGGMGGMMGGGAEPPYAGYLVNGRLTAAAAPLAVARGERVKLRIINASSATTHRVGLAGHQFVVTHADGQPVRPVTVDTLVVGMGERYDVMVTANNPGVWPLLAGTVDSAVPGVIVPFAYAGSTDRMRPVWVWPSALLGGRTLRYADLAPEQDAPPLRPLAALDLVLGGGMMWGTAWTINGQAYPRADVLNIAAGQPLRLSIFNATMVRHPMHLHGQFFRVMNVSGTPLPGIVKDTVLVDPMGRVDLDFVADNPGKWLLHCHHAYHMEMGMARVIEY